MRLHGYFRSSASYRVRIALNLKKIAVDHISHHLRRAEHRSPSFLALNPQGLVPALELDDGEILTQSLAIIEWLEEMRPTPALLPKNSGERANVRAFAQVIACDTHPIQNLKILNRLLALGLSDDKVNEWARETNMEGLEVCESMAKKRVGPFCFGSIPSLADVCLVPQLANARRFKLDLARYPRLLEAEAACQALDAFSAALPARQPDVE